MRIWIIGLLTILTTGATVVAQENRLVAGKKLGEWCVLLKDLKTEKKIRLAAVRILEGRYGLYEDGVRRTLLDSVLKEPDAEIRGEIVASLSRFELDKLDAKSASELVGVVGDRLKDSSGNVRETAASALGGPFLSVAGDYIFALADALRDEHPGARVAAAEALRNFEKKAEVVLDKLTAYARDAKHDPISRQLALQSILTIAPDSAATSTLLAGLAREKDAASALRVSVLDGMGKLSNGLDEIVVILGESLKDKDAEIRRAAAGSLGKMGPRGKSVWAAVKIAASDEDVAVRYRILRVLAELSPQNKEALDLLGSAAQKDTVVDNRLAAVAEIGNLGVLAKDLVPLLEKLADDDIRLAVREAAAKAAAKIKGL